MVRLLREMESLLARAVGQLGPPHVGATIANELRRELRVVVDQIAERIAPLEGRLGTVEVALSSVDTVRKGLHELIARATVTSRRTSAEADSIDDRPGSVELSPAPRVAATSPVVDPGLVEAGVQRGEALEGPLRELAATVVDNVAAAQALALRLTDVEEAVTDLTELRDGLAGLTARVAEEAESLDRRLAPIEADIDRAEALRGELAALVAHFDEQSWHVEQRLALLYERVDGIGAELGHRGNASADQPNVLDHGLTEATGDMAIDVERRLALVDTRMAALEQRLERVERLTAQMASDHEGFSEKLSEQVGLLKGRLTPVEEALARVDGLGGEVDRLAAMAAAEQNSVAQRVNRQLEAVLERLRLVEANLPTFGDVRQDLEHTEAAQQEPEIRVEQRLDGSADTNEPGGPDPGESP
ncbi:MAG: hypothetical protein M3O23_12315 [Actinomycetota bacterium]|nr:hypothetical protein [Actinomycetota bacterium]